VFWLVIRGERRRTGAICGEKYPDKRGNGPSQPSRDSPRHRGPTPAIRESHPLLQSFPIFQRKQQNPSIGTPTSITSGSRPALQHLGGRATIPYGFCLGRSLHKLHIWVLGRGANAKPIGFYTGWGALRGAGKQRLPWPPAEGGSVWPNGGRCGRAIGNASGTAYGAGASTGERTGARGETSPLFIFSWVKVLRWRGRES
jgi:hypothetical protein